MANNGSIIQRMRRRAVDLLLPEEQKQANRQALAILQEAYYAGPWQRQPQEVVEELMEVNPWVLRDALNRAGWEVLGYSEATEAEREFSVNRSRRMYRYSPLYQWAIWLWTSWGLGESIDVTIDDDEAQTVWDEFVKADRNNHVYGDDVIHELSNWLLIDGNTFLAFFVSTVDGEATVDEIDPEEIQEILTVPGQSKPLFYKRVFEPTDEHTQETWYYPDWQAWLSGLCDEEFPGDEEGRTYAEVVLPHGAFRADTQRKVGEPIEEDLGKAQEAGTEVCILHLHYNHKKRTSPWGWPMATTGAPWLQSHRHFVESRLAVAEGKAQFIRRRRVRGGSRAVNDLIQSIQSNLSQTQTIETNPPAPAGSDDVSNMAVETTDLPMTTGAGDARADNSLFAWVALLGVGLFPASAGLDIQRYATAVEMDKSQSMLFTKYQTYWSTQFRRMVRIVIGAKRRYGKGRSSGDGSDATKEISIDVSIDSFSLADFPAVAGAIAPVVGNMLVPLIQTQVIPLDAAKQIAASLWRVVLQALGVKTAADMTDDEAWEIGETPEEVGETIAFIANLIDQNIDEADDVNWESVAQQALSLLRDTGRS